MQESSPNPTKPTLEPTAQMSVRFDTGGRVTNAGKPVACLPVCPYCHDLVPDAERDKVHFPIAKRDGGTETLIGHHLCNLAVEGNTPRINDVRKAYAVYKATMRMSGAVGHQNRALLRLREAENPAWTMIQKTIYSQRAKALKDLSAAVKTAAEGDETIKWLTNIKGIGPVVTGGLVAYLWPLSRFPQVSSLWHYTGLHVVEGHKPKFERGKKADWNQNAFSALLDINQAIRGKNPIRDLYVKFRKIEDERHPELTNGHRLNRALRRTRKEFLKLLWLRNRRCDLEIAHHNCENRSQPGDSATTPPANTPLEPKTTVGGSLDDAGGGHVTVENH